MVDNNYVALIIPLASKKQALSSILVFLFVDPRVQSMV